MIPPFNAHGVLPVGRYPSDVNEVEQRFVLTFPMSQTRRDIYSGWRDRRAKMFDILEPEWEWVDGSFVTAKRDAGDVDIATFVTGQDFDQMPVAARDEYTKLANSLVSAAPQLLYGCHSFLVSVYPQGHPYFNHYMAARGYWDWEWSRDRAVGEKGFLEIRGEA